MLYTVALPTQAAQLNMVSQGPRFGVQIEVIRRYGALFEERHSHDHRPQSMLVGRWLSVTLYLGWWLLSTGPLVDLKVE
jgi:hypothetical protein